MKEEVKIWELKSLTPVLKYKKKMKQEVDNRNENISILIDKYHTGLENFHMQNFIASKDYIDS